MAAKFEVYLDKANQFRFRLKAANGETIATGESYPDKKSTLKGIASIRKNAPEAVLVDLTVEKEVKAKPKAEAAAKPKPKAKAAAKPKEKAAAKPKAK